MRRIATTHRPRLTTALVILGAFLLSVFPAIAQSQNSGQSGQSGQSKNAAKPQKKESVLMKVRNSGKANDIKNKHNLNVTKSIAHGNAVVLVIEDRQEGELKNQTKDDSDVEWVVKNSTVPLDGETVNPLDDGETVLPLGPTNNATTDQTVHQLLDGETVLPLEDLNQIRAAYASLGAWITPSERLLLQPSFLKIGLYPSVGRATGLGVVIADLDTGADTCHEALAGVVTFTFVDGADAIAPENCPTNATQWVPGYGHGTAVASMLRVVAPQSTIWAMRVFNNSGTALISDVYAAVIYAADHGVNVINMSFGTTVSSQALNDAMDYARGRGVTLIAAGGNSNVQPLMYPAAITGVKGIVAVDAKDLKGSFSNYSTAASFSAPGVGLWVAYPNHLLKFSSGTSYSSPLAAGEAALVIDGFNRMLRGFPLTGMVDWAMYLGSQNIDSLNPQYLGKLGQGRIYIPTALNATGLPQNTNAAPPTAP